MSKIAEILNLTEFEIYFGQLPEQNFALDYHYGRYTNGEVIKNK